MTEIAKCALCGEPMPDGEMMFKFHGYSGPCPKPPLAKKAEAPTRQDITEHLFIDHRAASVWTVCVGKVYSSEDEAREEIRMWRGAAQAPMGEAEIQDLRDRAVGMLEKTP